MRTEDTQLGLELSQIVGRIERNADSDTTHTPDTERLLRSVGHFGNLVRVSSDLQAEAVRAAHEAGASWARIGTHLGISRQAVQQRFDPSYVNGEPASEETRTLGPVSRSEELDHLNAAGSQGWRPIRSMHGEHVMQHDQGEWEVRRASVLAAESMPSNKDGWQAVTTRFPDCFYIRKLR